MKKPKRRIFKPVKSVKKYARSSATTPKLASPEYPLLELSEAYHALNILTDYELATELVSFGALSPIVGDIALKASQGQDLTPRQRMVLDRAVLTESQIRAWVLERFKVQ